jgi:hypothetical protein
MRINKRLLILFGVLDVVTLVRLYGPMSAFWRHWETSWITTGNLLIFISLIFSSYFLIRQNKLGLWLTYLQFPLRLLFMVLSFGFLVVVVKFFEEGEMVYEILMWGLLGLEIIRLIATIQIHRKYF